MKKRYAFHLGREQEIAKAEIYAVAETAGIRLLHEERCGEFLLVQTQESFDAPSLMRRLGGTVKIAREIPTQGELADAMAAYLDAVLPEEKIHFSVTGGSKHLGLDVKKLLKAMGRSVRYVESKNTATILHNQLVERQSDLLILNNSLFVTVAIQPFEEFSARDYGRPGRDSKSGMLPPKLARTMINLSGTDKSKSLLDPFCGSGTVIMEALLLGYTRVTGSDLSLKAIEDSKKNTAWIREMYQIKSTPTVFASDVRNLPEHFSKGSVNAIVTEPYLGKPQTGKASLLEMQKEMKSLAELYEAAFASFTFLLSPGGVVIWIMPTFRSGKNWLSLDSTKIIGKNFTAVPLAKERPYLLYARDDQHVGREIWKFKRSDS